MQYAVKVAKNKEQLLSQPLLKSVFLVLQMHLNDAQAVNFVIGCPTRRLWLLPQFLINLMQEHTQHTVLDVIIAQQQAEEILILGKSLNQRVICIVVEAELEVLLGVVLGRCLQLIRMQQQVLDLQHNFRHGAAIIALARAGVHLVNNFRQVLYLIHGQTNIGPAQLYVRCAGVALLVALIALTFLPKIRSLNLIFQADAAAVANDQIGQQQINEHIFLVQFRVAKAGGHRQELI